MNIIVYHCYSIFGIKIHEYFLNLYHPQYGIPETHKLLKKIIQETLNQHQQISISTCIFNKNYVQTIKEN